MVVRLGTRTRTNTTPMAQKPVLWDEVGARAWRVCVQTREDMWASACGAGRLGESACVLKPIKALLWLRGQLSLLSCSPTFFFKAPRDSGLCSR